MRVGLAIRYCIVMGVLAGCESSCKAYLNEECGVDPDTGDEHHECRDGLRCDAACLSCEGHCVPRGDSPLGQECEVTAECANGALCSKAAVGRQCTPPHSFQTDAACEQTLECATNLLCGGDRFQPTCLAPGSLSLMSSCSADAECVTGSYCDDRCRAFGQPGEYCGSTTRCRSDLLCSGSARCIAPHSVRSGEYCARSVECEDGLYCHDRRRGCAPAGTSARGRACRTTADCLSGLVCAGELCRAAGARLSGEVCDGLTDCAAGLACSKLGSRKECTAPAAQHCFDEESTLRAYFEIPRANEPVWEFYRLPFPNDIRRRAGALDLRGHDSSQFPVDTTAVLRDLERTADGFSTNPVVQFRFTSALRVSTLSEQSIQLVDITPGSPTYAARVPVEWRFDPRGSAYSCGNLLSVSPPPGQTLRAQTTYAALVTRQLRESNGRTLERAADLDALLAESPPLGLENAHAAYARLRAFARDQQLNLNDVLNVAVFTTQDPERTVIALRKAVRRDGLPTLQDVSVCQTGSRSPCEEAGRGACGPPNPDFWELHGRIRLPIYQQGAAPYATEGGGIELDEAGLPRLVRREAVCFAATIPKHPPPGPLPVVLFGHGTGGSFRGAILAGVARGLATGDVDGRSVSAVSIGFDLPQHGSRLGRDGGDPDRLFFNVENPVGSRGNVLQGAADLMAWLFFLTEGQPDALSEALGAQLQFDPRRIASFTHSQGSTHASIMLPYSPEIVAAVLSGNGGHLITSLLTKTEPVDVAGLIAAGLFDFDDGLHVAGGRFNPMLALIQGYFDSVDPINFAYRLQREPWSGAPAGRHVFMTYGLGDNFATEPTLQAYAHAAQFTIVRPVLRRFDLSEVDAPLRGNVVLDGQTRTLGLRQYQPDPGDDGHFVATRTANGLADALRFLRESFVEDSPSIGELSEH
jgi:hypothetical protein